MAGVLPGALPDTPHLSVVGAVLAPLRSSSSGVPARVNDLTVAWLGSQVSQPHPACPHRTPTPWDSVGFTATFSTQMSPPIPAWRGEREELPTIPLGGLTSPHHHSPARLQAEERRAPLVTSRNSAEKNPGRQAGRQARTHSAGETRPFIFKEAARLASRRCC